MADPNVEKGEPRDKNEQNSGDEGKKTAPSGGPVNKPELKKEAGKTDSSKEKAKPMAKPTKEAPAKPAPKAKKEKPPSRKFILSSSPHLQDGESVSKIMNTVTLTLMPAALGAAWIFGFRALILIVLGMVGAILAEWLVEKIFKAPSTIGDGSALLTGLLVSFNIPPGVPWWIPVVGSFFAIVVAKMPFGGLGHNPLNPALAGRAFLLASWPLHMTKDWLPAFWWRKMEGLSYFTWKVDPASFVIDGRSFATPLTLNKEAVKTVIHPEGLPNDLVAQAVSHLQSLGDRLLDLTVGRVGGCIGETSALLLLLGAAYLLYKNYIDWRTPISFIAVVGIGGWIFGGTSGLFSGDMLFHIFAGGLILGAFFMATDMVTSPITKKGKLVFGLGCGLITLMIRMIGGYPEGVSYAILLMNLTVPLIDRWFVPRRFGHVSVRESGAKA